MKYWMLAGESLADEPLEELAGRTPLEVAKTPFLDLLAKKGRVGSALFTPHSLAPTADVACMALLGFDPEAYYTGIAPLEALAMGISQNDHEVIFRCDFVTVLDEDVVDASASRISPRESKRLLDELNKGLGTNKVRFHAGEGYKNILTVSDPELVESLDELECAPPQSLIGQKFTKNLPRGQAARFLTDLMDRSKAILENHEINRVRVDLNENPANMIWPWGQGRRPKIPSFKQRYGLEGTVVSDADFVKGLGKVLGMETAPSFEECAGSKDFIFCYRGSLEPVIRGGDFKKKIRFIEEFDAAAGELMKKAEAAGDVRLCISSDTASSIARRAAFHGHVPFVMWGRGIPGDEAGLFNEKTQAQSKFILNEGHKLMEHFLR